VGKIEQVNLDILGELELIQHCRDMEEKAERLKSLFEETLSAIHWQSLPEELGNKIKEALK
jgi:hypothetical protein